MVSYNLLNLPSSAVNADQTVSYYYTSDGVKVEKDVIENNMFTPSFYAGNLLYDDISPKMLLIEGGYIDLSGDTPAYRFYVTDHQGNIRAVTDGTGTVLRTNHYDPYGEEVLPVLATSGTLPTSTAGTDAASRYMYGAKEWDADLSLYDFSARYYTPSGAASFTTMDPLCEKYYSISPYAYCAGNPVNMVDVKGEKIVFINGFSKWWFKPFGYLSPGVDYWSPVVINRAKTVLKDEKTSFESIDYGILHDAEQRRNRGYEYAKKNYSRLVSDLDENESIRFVTHSMGAAFAEGMADYLREQGQKVDILLHFSPFQAAAIKASSLPSVLTIDIQTENDPVLKLSQNSQGNIVNAKIVYGVSDSSKGRHTESMYNIYYWQEILRIINEYLGAEMQ